MFKKNNKQTSQVPTDKTVGINFNSDIAKRLEYIMGYTNEDLAAAIAASISMYEWVLSEHNKGRQILSVSSDNDEAIGIELPLRAK